MSSDDRRPIISTHAAPDPPPRDRDRRRDRGDRRRESLVDHFGRPPTLKGPVPSPVNLPKTVSRDAAASASGRSAQPSAGGSGGDAGRPDRRRSRTINISDDFFLYHERKLAMMSDLAKRRRLRNIMIIVAVSVVVLVAVVVGATVSVSKAQIAADAAAQTATARPRYTGALPPAFVRPKFVEPQPPAFVTANSSWFKSTSSYISSPTSSPNSGGQSTDAPPPGTTSANAPSPTFSNSGSGGKTDTEFPGYDGMCNDPNNFDKKEIIPKGGPDPWSIDYSPYPRDCNWYINHIKKNAGATAQISNGGIIANTPYTQYDCAYTKLNRCPTSPGWNWPGDSVWVWNKVTDSETDPCRYGLIWLFVLMGDMDDIFQECTSNPGIPEAALVDTPVGLRPNCITFGKWCRSWVGHINTNTPLNIKYNGESVSLSVTDAWLYLSNNRIKIDYMNEPIYLSKLRQMSNEDQNILFNQWMGKTDAGNCISDQHYCSECNGDSNHCSVDQGCLYYGGFCP